MVIRKIIRWRAGDKRFGEKIGFGGLLGWQSVPREALPAESTVNNQLKEIHPVHVSWPVSLDTQVLVMLPGHHCHGDTNRYYAWS